MRPAGASKRTTARAPILLRKALPGHVANRLQAALYREVAYLVQQDVLSVADADMRSTSEQRCPSSASTGSVARRPAAMRAVLVDLRTAASIARTCQSALMQ